jgi:hypothetical protein
MARLSSDAPARPLRVSSRALTGKVSLAEGSAAFESSLERDLLELLDFDARVLEIKVQPFSIHYPVGSDLRRYTPDVCAIYGPEADPRTVVYEVKPAQELKTRWHEYRPRFKAAVGFCREHGWRFKIVTEKQIRTPRLDNARFLRRYRRLLPEPKLAEQLRYTLTALGPTTPQALLSAAYWSQETRMRALPVLWQLVLLGEIGTDLSAPLTMRTSIWLEH